MPRVAHHLYLIAAVAAALLARAAAAELTDADLKRMRAETRVALVIGNGNYRNFQRLDNPVNDATGVAAALRAAGFNVTLKLDAAHADMNQALDAFAEDSRSADVALFYFAGHAAQVDWRNFILPVAANLDASKGAASELVRQVAQESVDLAEVLKRLEGRKNRLNIVILDACRDNPFTSAALEVSRSLSRSTGKAPFTIGVGLAQSFAPSGTFLAYSTAPGQVASDGTGRNSPYSAALIDALAQPGLKLEEVFKRVRNSVAAATANQQVPWDNSSVFREFYFRIPASLEAVNPSAKKRDINTTFVSP
ncbi:MAG TPA: caspase family protein [Steroidobacteraceae bacterium]